MTPSNAAIDEVLADRHDVTVLTAVPTFWSQLARHLERHPAPGGVPIANGVLTSDTEEQARPAHEEISGTLDIPVGTSKSHLFHARSKLRAALADFAPEWVS